MEQPLTAGSELGMYVMLKAACQARTKQLIQVGQGSSVPGHMEEY